MIRPLISDYGDGTADRGFHRMKGSCTGRWADSAGRDVQMDIQPSTIILVSANFSCVVTRYADTDQSCA